MDVYTPQGRSAGVGGAWILVVTGVGALGHAGSTGAVVPRGAEVAVVAAIDVGGVDASDGRVTGVVGADVPIVAGEPVARDACAVLAVIPHRADVAVLAGNRVRRVHAAGGGVAGVVGARVPVVAVRRFAGQALALPAGVTDAAGIQVVAGGALVVPDEPAGSGVGIAGRGQAGCGGAVGVGALDDAVRRDLAEVGEARQVAVEGPVAEVAVLQGLAVRVRDAVTVDGDPDAGAVEAGVSHGAGGPVVAGEDVVRVDAVSRLGITAVIGAGFAVVAVGQAPHADALIADVTDGAEMAVGALDVVQGDVLAAVLPVADVLGAEVAVVTGVFVHVPVAVVIQAVAELRAGGRGVAVGQALVGADPEPLAGAELRRLGAGRREPQLDGSVRAVTDARHGHALVQDGAGDALHVLADIPRRAIDVLAARPPAEGPLVTEDDAGGLRAVEADAVRVRGAGDAEGRVLRDADPDDVGIGPGLLAAPARGTLLLAGVGADGPAEVIDAQARETIVVVLAGIAEAALADLAGGRDVDRFQVRRDIGDPLRVAIGDGHVGEGDLAGAVDLDAVLGVQVRLRGLGRGPAVAGTRGDQDCDEKDSVAPVHGVPPGE